MSAAVDNAAPTPAHANQPAKLCKDCRHFGISLSRCNHPVVKISPVTGASDMLAEFMRGGNQRLVQADCATQLCGPDGTLFEECSALPQRGRLHFDLKHYSKEDILAAEINHPDDAERALKVRLRRPFATVAQNIWIDLDRLPARSDAPTSKGRIHHFWGNANRQAPSAHDADGSVQTEFDTLGVDRHEHSGAAPRVHAQEDDGVSVFGSFEDLSDALSRGATGSHRDHIDGPIRVVGVVVRREDVHAFLAGLRDLQASIGRHDNRHPQRPTIDQGVECQVVGAVSDGNQGTDDLQTLAPPVLRPHSSFRAAEIRDWADWVGNPVVIVVEGEPA